MAGWGLEQALTLELQPDTEGAEFVSSSRDIDECGSFVSIPVTATLTGTGISAPALALGFLLAEAVSELDIELGFHFRGVPVSAETMERIEERAGDEYPTVNGVNLWTQGPLGSGATSLEAATLTTDGSTSTVQMQVGSWD